MSEKNNEKPSLPQDPEEAERASPSEIPAEAPEQSTTSRLPNPDAEGAVSLAGQDEERRRLEEALEDLEIQQLNLDDGLDLEWDDEFYSQSAVVNRAVDYDDDGFSDSDFFDQDSMIDSGRTDIDLDPILTIRRYRLVNNS